MMPSSAMGSCACPLGPVYADWTLVSSSEAELSQHHEAVAWLSGPVYTVLGQKGSIWSSILFYWSDRCKLAVDLGLRIVSQKMTQIKKAYSNPGWLRTPWPVVYASPMSKVPTFTELDFRPHVEGITAKSCPCGWFRPRLLDPRGWRSFTIGH